MLHLFPLHSVIVSFRCICIHAELCAFSSCCIRVHSPARHAFRDGCIITTVHSSYIYTHSMIVHLRLALQLRLHSGLTQLWYIIMHSEPSAFTTCHIQMHSIACKTRCIHVFRCIHVCVHPHTFVYIIMHSITFDSYAIECTRMYMNAPQGKSKAPIIHTSFFSFVLSSAGQFIFWHTLPQVGR